MTSYLQNEGRNMEKRLTKKPSHRKKRRKPCYCWKLVY